MSTNQEHPMVEESSLVNLYKEAENLSVEEQLDMLSAIDEELFPVLGEDFFEQVYGKAVLTFASYFEQHCQTQPELTRRIQAAQGCWPVSLIAADGLRHNDDSWKKYITLFVKSYDQTPAGLIGAFCRIDAEVALSSVIDDQEAENKELRAFASFAEWVNFHFNNEETKDLIFTYWHKEIPDVIKMTLLDEDEEETLTSEAGWIVPIRGLSFTQKHNLEQVYHYLTTQCSPNTQITAVQMPSDSEEHAAWDTLRIPEQQDGDHIGFCHALRKRLHVLLAKGGTLIAESPDPAGCPVCSMFIFDADGTVTEPTRQQHRAIMTAMDKKRREYQIKQPDLLLY